VRIALRRWQEADSLLGPLDCDEAPFEVRTHAVFARALIADVAGRREGALRLYRQAKEHLDRFPQYNHQFTFAPLRKWIAEGLAAPRATGRLPPLPHLQRVP
jgi:hypothetical protein